MAPPDAHTCVRECSYIKGDGFSYWIPLSFNAAGDMQPFQPFVNSFSLDVADTFGVDHLPTAAAAAAA